METHLPKPPTPCSRDPEQGGEARGARRIPEGGDGLDSRRQKVPGLLFLNRDIGIEVGMDGQEPGAARRQPVPSGAIGHDVGVVVEIVRQAEGMSQLMGRRGDDEAGGKKRVAAVLARLAAKARHVAPAEIVVGAVVGDDEENAAAGIEGRSQIPQHVADADDAVRAQVAVIGVRRVHAMDHRVPLVVGLELEGLAPVAVGLHLVAEEGPDAGDPRLDGVNHVGVEGAVVGQEVDQLHRARLSGVGQGKRLGGRSPRVIAFPVPGVEGAAGMRPVDGRGGCRKAGGLPDEESQRPEPRVSGCRPFHGESSCVPVMGQVHSSCSRPP